MDLLSTVASVLGKRKLATNPDEIATNVELHKKQLKCRRILEIPLATTIEDLKRQIEEYPEIEGSAHGLTLVRSSPRYCMATLNSYEIPASFPYPVDDTFLGITPFAGSKESTVE